MAQIQSSASPTPPNQSSFPQDPADFDADSRISFDKLNQKFILETEDDKGNPLEFEYDDGLKRWIPVVDDTLLEQQRAAYAVKGVDESEPVQAGRKRKKAEYVNGEEEIGGRQTKKVAPAKPPAERKNTAVYITGLPTDTDAEEIQKVFSRCGMIAEEIDGQNKRIKMYKDDEGNFKGDALVMYFKPESVNLAVQLLDDSQFRLGEGPNMKVSVADFSYKQQKDAPPPGQNGKSGKGMTKEKSKIIKKTQKLNNKLADWSDSDDDPSTLTSTSSRWDKLVILTHMFTLAELAEDPAAPLDIKEDIRSECEKIGPVTNVVLFDAEPEGVCSVRFGNAQAARECVRVMDGRHFSGMVVQARVADGAEKFRKRDARGVGGEGEEEERLEGFGKWLEEEGKEGGTMG